MKKTAFIIALAVWALSSCKKDYSCTCTVKDSQGTTVATSSENIHDTRAHAKSTCSGLASSQSGGYTETCSI